jgi:hypothetical protein
LSAIRSFVIVLALSIHAIFEGMAIGKYQVQNKIMWPAKPKILFM